MSRVALSIPRLSFTFVLSAIQHLPWCRYERASTSTGSYSSHRIFSSSSLALRTCFTCYCRSSPPSLEYVAQLTNRRGLTGGRNCRPIAWQVWTAGPSTNLIPLVFVLAVRAFKDAFEELQRKRVSIEHCHCVESLLLRSRSPNRRDRVRCHCSPTNVQIASSLLSWTVHRAHSRRMSRCAHPP